MNKYRLFCESCQEDVNPSSLGGNFINSILKNIQNQIANAINKSIKKSNDNNQKNSQEKIEFKCSKCGTVLKVKK